MDRRRWLKGAGATIALGVVGTGAATAAVRFRAHPYFETLEEVRSWLTATSPSDLKSTGVWTPAQILSHGAQSIELTVKGFPEMKPAWFRGTVGPVAFAVFSALGGTRHDRAALIPGTALDDLDADPVRAHARLLSAVALFLDTENVRDHFAYGGLTRIEAERAHAMHISEHLIDLYV